VRLSSGQNDIIPTIPVSYADTEARVYLFGSNLDDGAQGGDVDLLLKHWSDSRLYISGVQRQREQATGDPEKFSKKCPPP
jgi:hypothetical protein